MRIFIIHSFVKRNNQRPVHTYAVETGIDHACNRCGTMMEDIEHSNIAVDWNAECGMETRQLLSQGQDVEFNNELNPSGAYVRIIPLEVSLQASEFELTS
jgi:hypothetical protein